MKKLFLLTAVLGVVSLAQAQNTGLGEFTCTSKEFRGGMGSEVADTRFTFVIQKNDEDTLVLEKLIGSVSVAREENEAPAEQYYSVFALKNLKQNKEYRPTVYTDSVQFPQIDTEFSSSVDGGGMWGQLVVAKDRSVEPFSAHYIFKSGDHLGGTIDLSCAARSN